MANPNLVNTSEVYMRTNIQIPISSATDILENPVSSNMIMRVDLVTICNTTSSVSPIDVYLTRSSAPYALASNITVPSFSSMVVTDRDYPIFLKEGDKLQVSGGIGLQAICSYLIISDTSIILPPRPDINPADVPDGTIDFLDSRDELSGSTITISSADFGTPSSNRIIIVGVATLNNNNPTAMTIGGISATEAVKTDVSGTVSSIWYAQVPSGTSGDIVITKPSDSTAVGWFAGYTSTPTVSDTGQYTGSSDASVTINGYNNGFMIWCQSDRSNQSTHTATWSGTGTVSTDAELIVSIDRSGSVGSVDTESNTTDGTFTLTAGADQNKVVVASWAP